MFNVHDQILRIFALPAGNYSEKFVFFFDDGSVRMKIVLTSLVTVTQRFVWPCSGWTHFFLLFAMPIPPPSLLICSSHVERPPPGRGPQAAAPLGLATFILSFKQLHLNRERLASPVVMVPNISSDGTCSDPEMEHSAQRRDALRILGRWLRKCATQNDMLLGPLFSSR